MGYYSDVAFIVPADAPRFEDVEDARYDEVQEKDGYRLYVVEGTKWYDESPRVEAVNKYLAELDTEGRYEDYLFIRIGEEDDDLEHEGALWNNPFGLGYVRKLTYEGEQK